MGGSRQKLIVFAFLLKVTTFFFRYFYFISISNSKVCFVQWLKKEYYIYMHYKRNYDLKYERKRECFKFFFL